MNHRILRLFSLCISITLLLAACQSRAQKLVPVTGAQEVALAAPAALARDSVLNYLLTSSRLAKVPPGTDWQLETEQGLNGEYHFRSGDWLMLIRTANTGEAIQQVMILNSIEKASWTGYVTAEGKVVDTAYVR